MNGYRIFDEFKIDSKGLKFSHDDNFEFDNFDDSTIPINKIGSIVGNLHSPVYTYSPKRCIIELSAAVKTENSKLEIR